MRAIFFLFIFAFSGVATAETIVRIVTDQGTIGVKMLDKDAPKTVDNFVKLARGEQKYTGIDGKRSNKPFYDGLTIHRVHPELGIFSGCQWGTGRGWPGYYMVDETPQTSKFDRPGLMAMAKVIGDTRVGSQFFITTKALPRLNGKYTVFGEVVSGLNLVQKIAAEPRDLHMKPKKPIYIKAVEISQND